MLQFCRLFILLSIIVALGHANREQRFDFPLNDVELCSADTALQETPLEGKESATDAQVRTVVSSSVLVVLVIVLIVVIVMILFLRQKRKVEKE